MDSGKTDNERELTSTMGNVLSVSIKDEKNDTSGSDATPTSSTDANTTTTSSQIVSDDPISSTSSDVVDLNKSKILETVTQSSVEVSQTEMEEPGKASSVDPETDLLEMSISSVSRERITEDVEDLVHDLESLLGESTDSFNIPVKRKEEQKSPVEKEPAKISHKPTESGDVLSLENSQLENSIEIVENDDKKKEIAKDITNFSLTEEQIETTESSSQPESELNTVNAEDEKAVNENISSFGDKNLPVYTSLESETSLECENVIANSQEVDEPDTVTDGNETIVETDSVETSNIQVTECVSTAEEECVEEIKDDNVNLDQDAEKIADVDKADAELEVPGEVIEEPTSITEAEDTTNNELKDDLKNNEEPDNFCAVEEPELVPTTNASSEDDKIKKDEPEKTEGEDTVYETESISRDTKTEPVESADNELKGTELSQNKELDAHTVDKISTDNYLIDTESIQDDKNEVLEIQSVHSDSVENNKENEETMPEICSETYVHTEKLGDTIMILSDSESSNQDETEIIEQSNAENVQEITSTPVDIDHTSDDIQLTPTVCEEDSSLKLVPDNTESNTEKPVDKIESTEIDESSITDELKSQINIPESSETENTPEDSIDDKKNIDIEEVIHADQKESLPVPLLGDSNSNAKESATEVPSESDVPNPITDDFNIIIEEISDTVESNEIDLTLESNGEETPQIEPIIEEVDETDDTKTLNAESESTTEQSVVEISELVTDEVPSPSNSSLTVDNKQSLSYEEITDNFVEQMDVPLSDAVSNVKGLIEIETKALTGDKKCEENIDEKCEEDTDAKYEGNIDEKCEEHIDKKCEENIDEKCEEHIDEKCEENVEKCEEHIDEKCEENIDEKCEEHIDEKCEENIDEKREHIDEKREEHINKKCEENIDEKCEKPIDEKCEENIVEECEENIDEKSEENIDEKCEENIDEKSEENIDEKCEENIDENCEQNIDENCEENVYQKCEYVDEKCEENIGDKHTNEKIEKCEENLEECKVNVDEKCEEELEPAILPEKVSDVCGDEENKIANLADLSKTNEVPKLTEDLVKICDEVPVLQKETPIESKHVVIEDTSIIESDDIAEVQTKNIDESPLVTIETVEESNVECEETIASTDDICEFSIGTSKDVDPELGSEVIKSVLVDEDISKTYNSQLEEDPVIVVEDLSTEEDKQVQDFEWVEDIVPEECEAASTTEVIQDDEIGDTSNKIIEILDDDDDDDSKIIQSGNVPFFSPAADSDSEDTVPTLVLEPDEVNPSPEMLHTEKETDQIEDSSIMVHSTNDPEIPDKLPEIEDILNDQGNIDDVVESIDMQENLETILAVASLQDTENVVEAPVEPQISDKERREMEALRMAVESITETAPVDFEQVEDVTELVETRVENVENQPLLQQVLPEIKDVDVVKGSNLKAELQVDSIEETKIISEEIPVQSSTVQNAEVSINEIEIKDDVTIEENHLIQEPTIAEEVVQTLPDTSEDKIDTSRELPESTTVLPDSSQSVSVSEEIKSTESFKEKESKVKVNERPKRHKKSSADSKLEELSINVDVPEREKPYSPKVTIKPIKVPDEEVSTTSISDSEIGKGSLKMTITKQFDKMHSVLKICESDNSELSVQEQDEPIPKLIIKPKMQQVEQQHSPKMSTRSSKQMYSPTSSTQRSGSPRITIKPVVKPEKESVSPLKIKIKPEEGSKKHSPKLNIKPVTKPEEECRENIQSPRKVTIKPVVKSAEEMEQVHSPRKVTIKPVLKSPEEVEQVQSPRITIKPIPKPELEKESISITPRLNIKPIKKQDEDDLEVERERSSPKITIKPLVKPQEPDTQATEGEESVKERIVLKINKGNLPTPTKESKKREHPPDDEKSEKLAKITVKFSKGGGHPHIVQQPEESNKRTYEEQSPLEKVKKLKTDNESPVLTRSKHKDVSGEQFTSDTSRSKQREVEIHIVETRSKHTHSISDTPIEAKRVKLRETPDSSHMKQRESMELLKSRTNNENNEDVRIIESRLDSPIVISEDSRSQDSGSCIIVEDVKDPLESISMYEISPKTTPETPVAPVKQDSASSTPTAPTTPTPRKRGRPRKVPIVVREEFKEQEEPPKPEPKKEEPPLVHESGRPKRSCRGQSVRATLGIKPRKPRGPGRGRGSKRGVGTRVVPMKPEEEPKLSKAKLKLIQDSLKVELLRTDDFVERDKKICLQPQVVEEDIKPPAPVLAQQEQPPSEVPSILLPEPLPQGLLASPALLPVASPKPASSLLTTEIADSTSVAPATPSTSRVESAEIVMVDEETRMSADINSRAQTPAKQVVPSDVIVIEESQSSVQSTATTESGKAASSRPNKAPRLEVQEPEGAVISADQLTEYYWNGNGPFMLQEQVAQFLGIKSFKRKYPGIMRRMLEMQERDFIRESGLASEHMCDLGLTAVNSADILDIMYSDFQEKYEEYCKHQRDRQAKELINKQKALSLAASQEKNKADITEQAVQSAAQWNASFNKTRKEQRKACMDLQTLTVHYPKGKMKQINKPKVGNYPVALVPGQFTDYYKEFTPTEINNLPLNTLCYNEINIIPPEESEDSGSEGSDSDSDSSSSSSDSCSSSSGVEDCKLCKHTPKKGLSSK